MKKVEIRDYSHAEVKATQAPFGFFKLPYDELIRAEGETLEVSDGYHTFDELYDHRITLYIALCMLLKRQENATGLSLPPGESFIWRSKHHSDGKLCFGTGTQFILGIGKEKGSQITYHVPIERWDETAFAETLDRAPEFDGHTSEDVLVRLKSL